MDRANIFSLLVLSVCILAACGTENQNRFNATGAATAANNETAPERLSDNPKHSLATGRSSQNLQLTTDAGRIPLVTKNTNMRADVRAPATTWDGRVAFRCYFEDHHPGKFCVFNAFQPEGVVKQPNGSIDLSNAFAADFKLRNASGTPFYYATQAQFRLAALSQDPTFDAPNGNPWRCNKGRQFDPNGTHECYEVMLVTYRTVNNNFQDGELITTRASITVLTHEYVNGDRRRVRRPQIEQARMRDSWMTMRSGGQKISLWEPSITADGRLLFVKDGQYLKNNSTSKNFGVFAASWSGRRDVSDLHREPEAFRRKYPVARKPLKDAFGRICNGYPRCGGHYHWVSPGGEDIFFTRFGFSVSRGIGLHMIGASTNYTERYIDGAPNVGRYTYVATIGAVGGMTGSMWFGIEEATKTSAFPVSKSPTVYPIIWLQGYAEYDPVRGTNDYDVYLPMTEFMSQRPVPSSGGNDMAYDNGAWRVVRNSPFARKLTPDISGHFNSGRLNAGAHFPNDYIETFSRGNATANHLVGFIGRGIYLTGSGAIQVDTKVSDSNPNSDNLAALRAAKSSINVHIAVKPLINLSSVRSAMGLAKQGDAWRLFLNPEGRLVFAVTNKDGKVLKLATDDPVRLPTNAWTVLMANVHAGSRKFSLAVNGERIALREFREYSGIVADDRPIIISPDLGGDFTNKPFLLVDEFGLSLRSRNLEFMAEAAGYMFNPDLVARSQISGAMPASLNNIPLGLPKGEMMIPRSTIDLIRKGSFEKAVSLGARIFNDKDLTGKNIACATCHNPDRQFIDTRLNGANERVGLSSGVNGKKAPRHTPVAFNRAWSLRQFADGRSHSLTDQVLQPIENPIEMGGNIQVVVNRLRDDAKYNAAFREIFGRGPTKGDLATTLATYLLNIARGNSEFDQVLHKQTPAADSERIKTLLRGYGIFAGKAGCIGCHRGPTWTDEEFHNTGSTIDGDGQMFDAGRMSVTGVPADRGAVKTPTLRRISQTAPYMISGRIQNLNDVISFYERNGRNNGRLDVQMRPFSLTPAERRDLIEFMKSL